jgi:DNA gyrase/topoisomerase IV subunit B
VRCCRSASNLKINGTDTIFDGLMGDKAAPRREFIEERAFPPGADR